MGIAFRDWVAAVKAAAPFRRSASSFRIAAQRIRAKPRDAAPRLADLRRVAEAELHALLVLPADPTGKLDEAREDLEAALAYIDQVQDGLIADGRRSRQSHMQ